MRAYEVMREVYDPCVGKWEIDGSFTREVRGDSPEALLQAWFHGALPPHQVDVRADGTVSYALGPPQRERYLFSAL